MARSKRKEEEVGWIRQRIVDAAGPVFSRKGYHGATMQEIAEAAGYSPAALYNYFPKKGDVFLALVERIGQRGADDMEFESPLPLPFDQRLRWVLHRIVARWEEQRPLMLTFLTQRSFIELDVGSRLREAAQRSHEHYMTRLAQLLEQGVREGALRSGNVRDYATVLAGMMHGFLFRCLGAAETCETSEIVDTIVRFFLHGVAREGAPLSPPATSATATEGI